MSETVLFYDPITEAGVVGDEHGNIMDRIIDREYSQPIFVPRSVRWWRLSYDECVELKTCRTASGKEFRCGFHGGQWYLSKP